MTQPDVIKVAEGLILFYLPVGDYIFPEHFKSFEQQLVPPFPRIIRGGWLKWGFVWR